MWLQLGFDHFLNLLFQGLPSNRVELPESVVIEDDLPMPHRGGSVVTANINTEIEQIVSDAIRRAEEPAAP
jgi:hypothetical protein